MTQLPMTVLSNFLFAGCLRQVILVLLIAGGDDDAKQEE